MGTELKQLVKANASKEKIDTLTNKIANNKNTQLIKCVQGSFSDVLKNLTETLHLSSQVGSLTELVNGANKESCERAYLKIHQSINQRIVQVFKDQQSQATQTSLSSDRFFRFSNGFLFFCIFYPKKQVENFLGTVYKF